MKKIYLNFLLLTFLLATACGVSKPRVREVAITEPWASMSLPCKEEGVIVVSTDHRFNCAYSGNRERESETKAVTQYVEILKQDGWKITQDISEVVTVHYQLSKNDKELAVFSTPASISTKDGARNWEGFGVQIETWIKKQN